MCLVALGNDLLPDAARAASSKLVQDGATGASVFGDEAGSSCQDEPADGLLLWDHCDRRCIRIIDVQSCTFSKTPRFPVPACQSIYCAGGCPEPRVNCRAQTFQCLTCLAGSHLACTHRTKLWYVGVGAWLQEASEPDGNLVTIQAALIWAFQAITTVGLTPSPGTGAGQVLNCILSVVGVLVLALPAGIIAAGFTEIHEEERRTRALKKSASFKFRANAIASRKEREKMQLAADAGVDVKATAPSDTSVEVQPMLNSPTTPHNGADVDSADFVSAECLARVEERQQRLEASMARMEAMLSSLVASAKQPREAGQQRDDWSYQSTEFDTTASRLLGAE